MDNPFLVGFGVWRIHHRHLSRLPGLCSGRFRCILRQTRSQGCVPEPSAFGMPNQRFCRICSCFGLIAFRDTHPSSLSHSSVSSQVHEIQNKKRRYIAACRIRQKNKNTQSEFFSSCMAWMRCVCGPESQSGRSCVSFVLVPTDGKAYLYLFFTVAWAGHVPPPTVCTAEITPTDGASPSRCAPLVCLCRTHTHAGEDRFSVAL